MHSQGRFGLVDFLHLQSEGRCDDSKIAFADGRYLMKPNQRVIII
jgi:hypothetical protein